MQKYLVIAYNNDRQQLSWDSVEAETAEEAVIFISKVRPFVVAAHAASAFQLEEIARDLKSGSITRIVH
jgi:hypothetical protein